MFARIKNLFAPIPEREDFPPDEINATEEEPSYDFSGKITSMPDKLTVILDETIKFSFPLPEQKYTEYQNAWNARKWQNGVIGFGAGGGSVYKLLTAQQNFDFYSAGALAVLSGLQLYWAYDASKKADAWKYPLPEYQEKRRLVESNIETSFASAMKNPSLFHRLEMGYTHNKNMLYWLALLENVNDTSDEMSANVYRNFLQNAPLGRESIAGLKEVIDLNKKKVEHLTTSRLLHCMTLYTTAQKQLNDMKTTHENALNVLLKDKEKIENHQQNMETGMHLGAQAAAGYAGCSLLKDEEQEIAQKMQEKAHALQAINVSNLPLYEKEIERKTVGGRYNDEINNIKKRMEKKLALFKAGGVLGGAIINQTVVTSLFNPSKQKIDEQIEQQKKNHDRHVTQLFSPFTKKIMDAYFKPLPDVPRSRL